MTSPSFVYAILSGASIKIGMTDKPEGRLSSIVAERGDGQMVALWELASRTKAASVEREALSRLSFASEGREWFDDDHGKVVSVLASSAAREMAKPIPPVRLDPAISNHTKAAIKQKRDDGFIPGGLPAIRPDVWPVMTRIAAEHAAEKKLLTDQRLSDLVYDETGKRISWATYRKWRARIDAGGDYPGDWQAKLDQNKANKKRAAKRAK